VFDDSRSDGTVSFKYDPFGRRIYKSSSSGTFVFAYDGDNLVEETNSGGTAVARYSQGLNIDEPLAMLNSGTTSYYHADGLGSVTSLSSSAGSLAQTYTFDSFGRQTSSSGSLTNPFQYTARELDPETNLYYYRARYYDQAAGRFVSEDPIRLRGGINFYAYVKNHPTLLQDPSGRVCWGGGLSGSGAFSAFWIGVGAEGSFYLVGDSLGNQGVLDCNGGAFGAASGVGSSVGLQGSSLFSPNCKSICDLQGGFFGAIGFGGVGVTGMYSGSATVGMTTATFTAGGGGGVGAGYGLVGVGGNCTLIWKYHNCPSCPKSQK